MLVLKVILLSDTTTPHTEPNPTHFIRNWESLKGFGLKDSHFKNNHLPDIKQKKTIVWGKLGPTWTFHLLVDT